MRMRGKRLLSLLLTLVMILSLVPMTVYADESSTGTYTKVTSAPDDWSGTYLIVSEGDSLIMDGSLDKLDAEGNKVDVTIEDGTITGNYAQYTFEIAAMEGGYSVKSASGSYIYGQSGKNALKTSTSEQLNTISFADGNVKIVSNSTTLQYNNAATNGTRFRYYKNENQQPISLYKLDAEPARESGIVTDLTTLQDGDSVVIFNPVYDKALSTTYSGFYNIGIDVTLADGILSGYGETELWTLGINEDGSYTFSTSEGKKLSMDTSYGSMPLDKANDIWSITAVDGAEALFFIDNVGRKAVEGNYNYRIQWDKRTGYETWSAYSGTGDTVQQQLYLVIDSGTEEPEPEPTPTPTYSTIAEALAGESGTEFTVKGVVTLVDGQNLYLQDATGGICLRLSSADSSIALGDTVIGTGSKTVYNGLPQLGSGTATKDSGLTLSAKATTIDALTTADICTYVKLTNVEVTEVYDNNGAYTAPNITVKDANDNTIQLYKAVIGKTDDAWDVAVGDKLDITAAVSYYQKNNTGDGKFQLRNTVASEVKQHAEGIIADGTYVVYNASAGKAMSSEATGTYYRAGKSVTLEDGKVKNPTNDIIWNFTFDGEYYTITTQDGNKLSMNDTKNSLPLDETNDKWTIEQATTDGCYYLVNATRTGTSGDHYYVEWYAGTSSSGSSFEEFTTYFYKSSNEAIYAMQLIPAETATVETGDLPKAGDKVVIYNQNAKAVLAEESDSQSINKALATITDGVATEVENGGVVFTVEKNGDYYRFKNETYGYLCSNGTGNNAFYSKDFSEEGVTTEDADWLVRACSGGVGGYEMESRTAKYNGTYSQWLEYYSDSFKTYSMYKVTDYTIYSFFFYPVAEGIDLTGDIVNAPVVTITGDDEAYVGADYTFTVEVDAVFGVDTMTVKSGETALTADEDGVYTISAASITGESFTITVTGEDTKNVAFSGSKTVTVKDEPVIGAVTPASNSQTGDNKKPVISAEIVNAGENPTITMTVNSKAVEATYADGKVTYTPAEDMADGRTTVTVTVKRADGKETSKTWSFTVGTSQYQLYFGQLHSHTQYSDGSGTLESALSYIKNLPASANVQFVAFTDHSNYFDGSKTSAGTANPEGALYDMSLASSDSQKLWNAYNKAVADFNEENAGEMVALAGFEMTWSGGPGHINTFNTPGIVSRNNTTLNNKTADAGMKAYYALLSQEEGIDSISQFNHPGSTFGTFSDFSYWDAVIDSRMYLVEVGNGEGQIGAGGYYPSYEYYTMALDKGWHLAPTNNQDNHKGKWGNANDARDVILTDNFTEEGIYAAIRDYRLYATEDKNLEITYTVNDLQMGSIISTEDMPEKLNFNVTVYDPDNSDSIAKVELVVNSGKVAYTWDDPAELANGELTATLDPTYSYYFVRVTEGDGDLAVTAPVWVGESLKLGISSVECGTSTPVTDEELTITTTLFNSESSEATIKSVTYTVGDTVLEGTKAGDKTVPASGTATVTFDYTPTVAKVMTVTATVVLTLEGEDYTFSMDVELDVQDASKLMYIGIDASHYNEYVAGNYADSMGNFTNLAAEYGIRTVELKTSEDLIAACSNDKYVALIMTAPSRRLEAAQKDIKVYTADEIAAIKAFNAAGGTVIMAGWSDHYEYYPDALTMTADQHMAATQNAVLEALGSSIRISDDATYDDVYSAIDGCDAWRLYFNTYNFDNFLVDGVEVGEGDNAYNSLYTEKFSHYGGASIYTVDGTLPATVSPVVYAHDSTYSVDVDKDGLGGTSTPKYAYAEGDERLLIMASEQLEGQGLIVVSGAAFMSNFEVQATVEDNGSEKNYSNYKICENLLAYLNPVTITPIADVQAEQEEGVKFTIEGIVTSNASGCDADTAFFDCIYVQDDTAGINAFPVAGSYKIGDKVRITGTTSSYQGERQIAVTSIEKLGEETPVEPKAVTAADLENQGYLGSLVTVEGTATKIEYANGLIQTIMVKDDSGKEARVFIDGYITTAKDVENAEVGCHVKATGLASYDNTFTLEDGTPVYQRIRIRDRADVVCTESTDTPDTPDEPDVPVTPDIPIVPGKPGSGEAANGSGTNASDMRFKDVRTTDWFYDDVRFVYEKGIMNGTSADQFEPNASVTRGMTVTILYRMQNSPAVSGSCTFADVDVNQWYGPAVVWAAENGIVTGYSAAAYGPNDPVTREQLATILYRYAVFCGMDAVTLAENLGGFSDVGSISSYAVSSMNWAVGQGLINGSDSGLMPKAQATRAQVAAIIHRYLEG